MSVCVVSFMSELQNAYPASLEEVLVAVKETARGRWFLENYEARLRGQDNARILEAINKLENHVLSVAKSTPDGDLVKRARDAITAARRDIAALEPSATGLTPEARLFAQLADKARTSFNGPPTTGQSVSRALQLVGDLDREFSAVEPIANFAAPTQLFKQDEAIFEPAPKRAATPAGVASGHIESSPRGAKLLVSRFGAQNAAEVPNEIASASDNTPEVAPQFAPPETATPTLAAPLVEPTKSRIVVIRRKAEEMEGVPLLDQIGAGPHHSPSAA